MSFFGLIAVPFACAQDRRRPLLPHAKLRRVTSTLDANPTSEKTRSASAVETPYDANGVDRSLVRWMLRQTPAQRLAYAQGVIDLAAAAQRSRDGNR